MTGREEEITIQKITNTKGTIEHMTEQFIRDFENPPAKNRIKPFWFWNGDMNDEEVEHQIRELAEKGLGGAFLCARQGMQIPYLSGTWFDKVGRACEIADSCGLETWLYDEYPYPSGMSGGEVLLRHPEAKHKILDPVILDAEGEENLFIRLGWGEILLACATPIAVDGTLCRAGTIDIEDMIGNLQMEEVYQQSGLTAYNRKRFFTYGPEHVLCGSLPKGQWRIEVFSQRELEDFKYYGGYFDPCSREAVRTFLDTTHERYAKYLGERFGNGVLGMFSDEVGLLGRIPWSPAVIKQFEEKNGYPLKQMLPALTDKNFPNAWKLRYDFFSAVNQVFVENYHKQVGDWCREHHLMYATEVPTLRISAQRYSDVIGGDTAHEKLGKPLEWIYDQYLPHYRSNAKAVASLARQLDKPFAMIESFHSIGWTMTLQDAKWMVDRLGADGINLFNFHAFYYTIDSITKHDAPPSQFLQNPYWKYYRLLADYVGRMSVMNTMTDADNGIAVLDPAASLWCLLGNGFHSFHYSGYDEEEKKQCQALSDQWIAVCKTILFAQLNYDHLDGEILADARVEEGNIRLGRASYQVLVLPPAICLEAPAAKKLQEFLLTGGQVVAVGAEASEIVGGEAAGLCESIKAMPGYYHLELTECVNGNGNSWKKELVRLLKQLLHRKAEVLLRKEDQKDFITAYRRDEEGNPFVFLSNQGKNRVAGVVLRVLEPSLCQAVLWNLETGRQTPLALSNSGEHLEMELDFHGYESMWIQLLKRPIKGAVQGILQTVVLPTREKMKVSLEGGNVYRFEHFELSLDGRLWKRVEAKTGIEQLEDTKLLGGDNTAYGGTFGTPKKLTPKYPLTLYYRAEYRVDAVPGNLSLLMDQRAIRGDYAFFVNGVLLEEDGWKPVRINDFNNRSYDIAHLTHAGRNEVRIQVTAADDSCGIRDPLYLLGDFSLRELDGTFAIKAPVKKVRLRSSYMEGYPFYSGTFIFSKEHTFDMDQLQEEFWLEFDFGDTLHDCIGVSVNGRELGVRAFAPYGWRVKKEWLKEKNNHIEIRVTNTLANMLDGTYFDYEAHQLVKIGLRVKCE